jgi:hypothetical protein
MTFSEVLLPLLKRIDALEYAYASTGFNEDGVFGIEVIMVHEGNVGTVCALTEDADEVAITQFELQIDLLENAVSLQKADDAANEARTREILGKLTKEEREHIGCPLPEDDPTEEPV